MESGAPETAQPRELDGTDSEKGHLSADGLHPILHSLNLLSRLSEQAQGLAGRHTAEPLERDERVLEALAESTVAQLLRSPFDPRNPSDRLRLVANENDVAGRRFADEATLVAIKRERDRLRLLGGSAPATEPTIWAPIAFLAIGSLTLSFAPTFKDLLFRAITDQLLGWFLAAISGLVLGGIVTGLQLSDYSSPSDKGLRGVLSLVGGTSLGIANWIVRAAVAAGSQEHQLALGQTAVALATVILIHAYAHRLGRRYQAFREYERRQHEARTATEERQRAEERVSALASRIASFHAYVDARRVLSERFDEVRRAARAYIVQQYLQKVRQNRDDLLG